MLDLIKSAVGGIAKFAKGHPVLTGVSLAAMVLPRLFGSQGGSPQAMMGAQQAIGAQIPPGGIAPGMMPGMTPGMTPGMPPAMPPPGSGSPGYW